MPFARAWWDWTLRLWRTSQHNLYSAHSRNHIKASISTSHTMPNLDDGDLINPQA